jgi:hypothetical protein
LAPGREKRLGLRGALKTGGLTVIQRFNSAVDASVHFHSLMLDGLYQLSRWGRPRVPSDARAI